MIALVLVLFGAIALAHAAPFPFLLEAFRPSRSLWRVKPAPGSPPTIYLTFDDGPHRDWTPPLLEALGDAGVQATFFLIDEHITAETAPIVRQMAAAGHAIGLHSGTRRLMVMPPDMLAATLNARARRIVALAGREPCRLFRPHAGWRSTAMYNGLERAGYRLAGWSWGLWDWDWWRHPHADRLAARLARRASGGDIVVIHDGHHANPAADRRHAAATVRILVPALQTRGFTFGTLCESARATSDGP